MSGAAHDEGFTPQGGRSRRGVFLFFSLLVHAGLLWFARRHAAPPVESRPPPRPPMRADVRVDVRRAPAPVRVEKPASETPHRRAAAPKPRADSAVAHKADDGAPQSRLPPSRLGQADSVQADSSQRQSSTAAPDVPVARVTPTLQQLLSSAAREGLRAAPDAGQLTDAQRREQSQARSVEAAQAQVDAWNQTYTVAQLQKRQRLEGPQGVLAPLREDMREWFHPLADARALSVPATDGASDPATTLRAFSAPLSDDLARRAGPGAPQKLGGVALLSLGDNGSSHLATQHETMVQVDHDARGWPERYTVLESSGNKPHDDHVLDTLRHAEVSLTRRLQREFGAVAVPAPASVPSIAEKAAAPIARWSRWLFRTQYYKWRRDDFALDPAFIPPGRVVSETELYRVSATSDVVFVAAEYRANAGPVPSSAPLK